MFDNPNDANRYLAESICIHNGVPVYIDRVDANMTVRARVLPLKQDDYDILKGTVEFKIDDPAFNCRSFGIGYLNGERSSPYLMRTPQRGNIQGLCYSNLHYSDGGRVPNQYLVYSQGFVDMLCGKYPGFEESMAQLMKSADMAGRAFSRHFALRRHPEIQKLIHICYKGRDIGWGSDSGTFTIGDEYQYLAEVIEQSGAKVV